MRYENVLETFVAFFEREEIDFALTGDLSLHIYGHPRTRPRFDFIVDAGARERTREFADICGFSESRCSANVSVYESTPQKIAFIFGTVRPSFPGLFFRGRFISIVDPARRLPLTKEDVHALESATMKMDFQAWMDFIGSMLPRRRNTYFDQPFEL